MDGTIEPMTAQWRIVGLGCVVAIEIGLGSGT